MIIIIIIGTSAKKVKRFFVIPHFFTSLCCGKQLQNYQLKKMVCRADEADANDI
jgi:hypothetical protein